MDQSQQALALFARSPTLAHHLEQQLQESDPDAAFLLLGQQGEHSRGQYIPN